MFGALEPEQLEQLVSYAGTRRVPAGTTLFSKGDPGIELLRSAPARKISVPAPDGREAMFNLLHPGEIFGEIALLDGRPRTADAMAMTDCELTVIERRDFLAFVQSEPNVALRSSRCCANVCASPASTMRNWCSWIFRRAWRASCCSSRTRMRPAPRSQLKITQREISQMLGLTRESVNKSCGPGPSAALSRSNAAASSCIGWPRSPPSPAAWASGTPRFHWKIRWSARASRRRHQPACATPGASRISLQVLKAAG